MATVYNHNCKDFIITAGPYVLSGFGESDSFTVAYDNEIFTTKSGIDGQITRSKNNSANMAVVTVKLMQNAKANAELYTLAEFDANTQLLPFPLSIINTKTGTSYICDKCWIEKWPDETASQEVGELEWMIKCADLKTVRSGVNLTI